MDERKGFWKNKIRLGKTTLNLAYNKKNQIDYSLLYLKIQYTILCNRSCIVNSGLWTKNTALWARDWGQKKGAVRLRFKEEALREFGHPKSYPLNSLLVNVSPGKGPSYCSLNLILRLNWNAEPLESYTKSIFSGLKCYNIGTRNAR